MPSLPEIAEQIEKLDPVEQEELLYRVFLRRDDAPLFRMFHNLPPVEREELLFSVLLQQENHPLFRRFHVLRRPTRYPGIVRTPGVCGGAARFIRTRIPVWTVVRMRQLGFSDLDILKSYPSLQAVDLAEAWAFAEEHREEMEKEIRENEEE